LNFTLKEIQVERADKAWIHLAKEEYIERLREERKKRLYSTKDGVLLVERARIISWRKIPFLCIA
jgi:hypothetical protein